VLSITERWLFAGKPGALASASLAYCLRAAFLEVPLLQGPVARESRSEYCLLLAENPRAPIGPAPPVSGHSLLAAAQAKAVPAVAAADQLWVAEDQEDKAVLEEEEVVVVD
jgi:hypothetical protein